MKEKYDINKQAVNWAQELAPFTERHQNIKLDINKAALLVIDMQKFFYEETSHAFIPSIKDIVPNIQQLQNHVINNNGIVIQTKHGNTEENAGQMTRWWQGSILKTTDPLANIIPELQHPQTKVLNKTQYDAFWQSGLDQYLKRQNITQLIITGVMTHLCCETTARAAFVRGYDVFFAIDGTATYNSKFHFNSLYNLAHGFAKPILIQKICKK